MLTEIGALVGIVKGLLDVTKAGKSFLAGFGKKEAASKTVAALQERVDGIAAQIHHCAMLTKMLPDWMRAHSRFDLFQEKLTDEQIRHLDSELRDFIVQSVHDSFSGIIFQTNFDSLPGMEFRMKVFREDLAALDATLNSIQQGDFKAWRQSWTVLKFRLGGLRQEALQVGALADKIFLALLQELKDAAKVKS